MEKVLSNTLLRIISLGLSYWFYRGHLEQYVHYIAHYGPYFQVFLNLVIIISLGYFVYAFLKLLLTRKIKKQTLLLPTFLEKHRHPRAIPESSFLRSGTILGQPLCSHHEPINVHPPRAPLFFPNE